MSWICDRHNGDLECVDYMTRSVGSHVYAGLNEAAIAQMSVNDQDNGADRRERILIGVFKSLDGLLVAIDELAAEGGDRRDMILVADAGALDGELETRFPAMGRAGGEDEPAVLIRLADSDVPLATRPGLRGNSLRLAAGRVLSFKDWFASGLSRNLDDHLHDGAALLVVPVRTAREERIYSETMLYHSIDTVQLHDLTVTD